MVESENAAGWEIDDVNSDVSFLRHGRFPEDKINRVFLSLKHGKALMGLEVRK